ncbi:hypothetical protein [Sphingopyxis sp. BSNA05]|uniref:hypothetical protein n=1 Tax=Sphingopyxis sp. BSNA05 TaxID=1236614 RepID=UPI0015648244|nr:hypothetical protein [Sphingopyxis sp. BSNA05]
MFDTDHDISPAAEYLAERKSVRAEPVEAQFSERDFTDEPGPSTGSGRTVDEADRF